MVDKRALNSVLSKMRKSDVKAKGELGELACMLVLEDYASQLNKYALFNSYTFLTDPTIPGNLFIDGDSLTIKKDGKVNNMTHTEIDVVLLTEFRIFVIEVKSYKAKKIVVTDKSIKGVMSRKKSPIHQNEMHCRQLYPKIAKALPYGDPSYLTQVTCFVDNAKVVVECSDFVREYSNVSILNSLRRIVSENNTPINSARLDIQSVYNAIKNAGSQQKSLKLKGIKK